ncbi:MAG: hypothetical protein WAW17_14695 [Rhodococcus sp. (in: high G+C Gram-positive bacteria)]|uniref:hypothetical protein n=1 Tax=Rhodococcus sp. TaxID=1831 RepID=UPI003BAF4833
MWPTHWPRTAREIAEAIDSGVAAARASAEAGVRSAADELAALPLEQVGAVSAAIVRELLETVHPDGLTGEDVQDVLTRCVRSASVWFPTVEVDSLVFVLTGALGVADVEETPTRPGHTAEASILLISDLLGTAEAPADGYIRRALDEIARAETVEMP